MDALPVLTELTDLQLLDYDDRSLDLSPLRRLPLLRHLSLDGYPRTTQYGELKQLAGLVSYDGGQLGFNGEAELMLAMLTPPHSLQRLEQLDLHGCVISPPILAALLHLPALTALEPFEVQPRCWAGLGAFTQLRTLRFQRCDSFTAAHLAAMCESLNALTHLSNLDLSLLEGSEAGAPALSPALRLPSLSKLRLHCVRVASLSFLQHSPLIEELRLKFAQLHADDVMECLRSNPLAHCIGWICS